MARARGADCPTYVAHVVPGLESLALDEVASLSGGFRLLRTLARFDERTSLILFGHSGPSADLLRLRTTEDVFVLAVAADRLPSGREGLAAIRLAIARAPDFERALSAHRATRPSGNRTTACRVVARMTGHHAFRRVDAEEAVETAIRQRYPHWKLAEDRASLEIWMHLVGQELIVGLRLSDETMRQRTYKIASLPASLKPTIAHAMVTLSDPHPDDVVLDPMCGAGTILIERALAARYRLLLGGDIDPAAADATRRNVGPRHRPIAILQWDATRLPLADGSVTRAITNLPFGRQVGSPADIERLYPAALRELGRVVRSGGKAVLLASNPAVLGQALHTAEVFHVERRLPVLVRGFPAAIWVLTR